MHARSDAVADQSASDLDGGAVTRDQGDAAHNHGFAAGPRGFEIDARDRVGVGDVDASAEDGELEV